MKLKIGDKVYLQKYDVAFILSEVSEIPASFPNEVFGNNEKGYFCMDIEENGFRFENVFESKSCVDWLMAQDWLVDYDEHVKDSLSELEALALSLKSSYNTGALEFNAHDEEYKTKRYEAESERYGKLRHKITSIECLIASRKGTIKFGFPPGYQDKAKYETPPPPKKQSFFKRLFGRK